MSVIVELRIPADEFALRRTLAAVPDARFEIERVAAYDEEHFMPFVWVDSDDREGVEAALADDPTVESHERLVDLGEELLYRMNWTDRIHLLVSMLVGRKAVIRAANGQRGRWNLRMLFSDRGCLSELVSGWEGASLDVTVLSIYQLEGGRSGRFGLTEAQRKTLVTAYERGYYGIPQDVTMRDLTEELGVSQQALSERLRRGHHNLIENGLVIGRGADGRHDEARVD